MNNNLHFPEFISSSTLNEEDTMNYILPVKTNYKTIKKLFTMPKSVTFTPKRLFILIPDE